ncbi:MAG: hypothetical protein HYV42_03545 [Candidatus Magasanikbacteria bacterium]|nr:hypothetical protein [Candidatus Magasanikbacteria bacterium]
MEQTKQFELASREWELTQGVMDKYDALSIKIKAWAVTVWVAGLGWSFSRGDQKVLGAVLFLLVALWVLDAVNKDYRNQYKKRRDEISAGLQHYWQSASWPAEFVCPQLPGKGQSDFRAMITRPHIAILYLALMLVTTLALLIK